MFAKICGENAILAIRKERVFFVRCIEYQDLLHGLQVHVRSFLQGVQVHHRLFGEILILASDLLLV